MLGHILHEVLPKRSPGILGHLVGDHARTIRVSTA